MFKLPIDQLMNYRFQNLRQIGFNPRTILDIGAYHGNWSDDILAVFPEANVFMIEGNPDCDEYLKKKGYPYVIALLSDSDKSVNFHKHNGLYKTGDSIYQEMTSAYDPTCSTITIMQTTTLKSVAAENDLLHFDMIKIDVQGSEMDVMKGGEELVRKAEVVLLELQLVEYNSKAPMFNEMVVFMDSLEFQMFDIIELHYTPSHILIQVDILFVKKTSSLIQRGLIC